MNRRAFLKLIGATAAVAALVPAIPKLTGSLQIDWAEADYEWGMRHGIAGRVFINGEQRRHGIALDGWGEMSPLEREEARQWAKAHIEQVFMDYARKVA